MKTVVYMAITLDGFIAREDGSTDFASAVEWDSYKSKIMEIGNVVMGRRTYNQMASSEESYINETTLVVVTSDTDLKIANENIHIAHSPQEALEILEQKGFKTALIGGGGSINASFLKENLVDELYIDLEPIAIGKGISLFEGVPANTLFELIGMKNLSPNELQLHYRALKD